MKCIILSGIPCSGKSTYRKKYLKGFTGLSRDECRLTLFGKNYKQNSYGEKRINIFFDYLLEGYCKQKDDICIDNCNCKLSYINNILLQLPDTYEVEIKYFPIPLWKAYIRNVLRYIKTGKYIPISVIKNMKKNFDKLNKNDCKN